MQLIPPPDLGATTRKLASFSSSRSHFTTERAASAAGRSHKCKRENMNAFKAFKAQVPIAWSPHLYITLVRGIPGTRRLHRRTLEALRLRKCNRTVMRWNTPTVRGMLQQVKRLVVIETEEMYKARKQNDVNHRAVRPPLVINHLPASASSS
ncbi:hypothetical protein NC652_007340 [Populus alba x Populus x berolinensis]|nr:hypothetical protein NC652_007340 [Populus alba x Populus x berolinensis]